MVSPSSQLGGKDIRPDEARTGALFLTWLGLQSGLNRSYFHGSSWQGFPSQQQLVACVSLGAGRREKQDQVKMVLVGKVLVARIMVAQPIRTFSPVLC